MLWCGYFGNSATSVTFQLLVIGPLWNSVVGWITLLNNNKQLTCISPSPPHTYLHRYSIEPPSQTRPIIQYPHNYLYYTGRHLTPYTSVTCLKYFLRYSLNKRVFTKLQQTFTCVHLHLVLLNKYILVSWYEIFTTI